MYRYNYILRYNVGNTTIKPLLDGVYHPLMAFMVMLGMVYCWDIALK